MVGTLAAIAQQAPNADELEVTLFGPGYGESILLHVGDGRWVIIDSCLVQDGPNKGRPHALARLAALNVDTSHVDAILLTHWHDDHVRGIASVVAACPQATVAISSALRRDEFLELVSTRGGKTAASQGSGVDEFKAMIAEMNLRNARPRLVNQGGIVRQWPASSAVPSRQLIALSPSLADEVQSLAWFAQDAAAAKAEGIVRPIKRPATNLPCVVTSLQISGSEALLLGSDIENGSSAGPTGWHGVRQLFVPGAPLLLNKAQLYKVAHHGSEGSNAPFVWSEMLATAPTAIVSPFRRGTHNIPSKKELSDLEVAASPGQVHLTSQQGVTKARMTKRALKAARQFSKKLVAQVSRDDAFLVCRKKVGSGMWDVFRPS